jgi:hypothetical protein
VQQHAFAINTALLGNIIINTIQTKRKSIIVAGTPRVKPLSLRDTHGGDEKQTQNIGRKHEGKRPTDRSRRRWIDNIKIDLMEVVCGRMGWSTFNCFRIGSNDGPL